MNHDIKYIHFWKKEVPDVTLDRLLEHFKLYNRKVWLVLLEEKLTRVERDY